MGKFSEMLKERGINTGAVPVAAPVAPLPVASAVPTPNRRESFSEMLARKGVKTSMSAPVVPPPISPASGPPIPPPPTPPPVQAPPTLDPALDVNRPGMLLSLLGIPNFDPAKAQPPAKTTAGALLQAYRGKKEEAMRGGVGVAKGLSKTYSDPKTYSEEIPAGLADAGAGIKKLGEGFVPPKGHTVSPITAIGGGWDTIMGLIRATGIDKAIKIAGEESKKGATPVSESPSVAANVLSGLSTEVVSPTLAEVGASALPVENIVFRGPQAIIKLSKALTSNTKAFKNAGEGLKAVEALGGRGQVADWIGAINKSAPANVARPGMPIKQSQLDVQGGKSATEIDDAFNLMESELEHARPKSIKELVAGKKITPADPAPLKNANPNKLPTNKMGTDPAYTKAKVQVEKALNNTETRPRAIHEKGLMQTQEEVSEVYTSMREFEEIMGLSFQKGASGLRSLDPLVSNPYRMIGPASEKAALTLDKIAEVTEGYQKVHQGVIASLKKKKFGKFWKRDRAAEGRVSRAMDDKTGTAFKALKGKELDAYMVERALMNKLADLSGMARDQRITHYWPHTFKDPSLLKRFKKTGEFFDPDSGMTFKPSKAGFLKHRKGMGGYSYDLGEVISARINAGVKKSYLGGGHIDEAKQSLAQIDFDEARRAYEKKPTDPYKKAMVKAEDDLRKANLPDDGLIGNLKNDFDRLESPEMKEYFENWMARLQGRPLSVEKWIDDKMKLLTDDAYAKGETLEMDPRKNPIAYSVKYLLERAGKPGTGKRASGMVTKIYYRSILGAALDTALKNSTQIGNVVGEAGFKNTAKAIGMMLTPSGRRLIKEKRVISDLMSIMEQTSLMSDSYWISKVWDRIIFSPMELTEYTNRGIAYWAGVFDAAEKLGKNAKPFDVHRYAMNINRKTNFQYGPANISPYLNNPVGKMAYQFSSFKTNQMDLMRRWSTEGGDVKLAGKRIPFSGLFKSKKAVRFFAFQGAMLMSVKGLWDVDLRDTMGWTDEDSKFPKNLPFLGYAEDIASSIPIVSKLVERDTKVGPGIALLGGGPDWQREDVKANLASGFIRDPRRSRLKFDAYVKEKKERMVRSKAGKKKYKLKKGEAGKRYFSLKPGSERDYKAKRREKEEKAERRKERKEKRRNK